MEIQESLESVDEIVAYVGKLWRSDEVKASHDDPNGYIRRIVEDYAAHPRVVIRMTRPDIETSHFSTWWNALQLRPWYENGAVSDLYYFHEIVHATKMYYDPALPWNRWYRKMVTNEFETSLESEVFVYFELPGLRAKSFPHDIWADRFLEDEASRREYADPLDPHGLRAETRRAFARAYIAGERKRAMTTPDPFNFLELQIANYLEQNIAWARIWAKRYREVEAHMQGLSVVSERSAALTIHQDWLKERAVFDRVPFLREAEQFAEVYKENKRTYGNQNLEPRQ